MKVFYVLCISVLVLIACSGGEDTSIVEQGFTRAEQQLSNQLKAVPEATEYPRTIGKDGKLKVTRKNDWTEGFYPGCLWYVYEYTNKEDWKKAAIKWTESLEPLKKMTNHHDIGFLMYCSFGNAYRLTGNEAYKDVLVESARSLCTRFNEKTGCIKSWNYRKSWNGKDEWFYPVIIDNMMNLELLYFATKVTGDSVYAKVANRHAETTAKNQFREDYSNYHVVNYDAETGEVLNQATCQGFSDNSAWARGQAWALYGYTTCYRYTHDKKYLDQAQKVYNFIFTNKNMPEDLVPYWDFDAPNIPNEPRDASAASCTASALYELETYLPGNNYKATADKIMESLGSPAYRAAVGTNGNFILMHSVGSIPHGAEIDVPLNYADYYFLEALIRKREMEGGN